MDGSPPQNGGRNYQANSPTTHDPYQYQANSTSSSSGSPSSNAYPSHGHTMQGSSYHQHHPQAGWAYGPGSGQSPPEGMPSSSSAYASPNTRVNPSAYYPPHYLQNGLQNSAPYRSSSHHSQTSQPPSPYNTAPSYGYSAGTYGQPSSGASQPPYSHGAHSGHKPSFSSHTALTQPIGSSGPSSSRDRFYCSQCTYSFTRQHDLKRHISTIHSQDAHQEKCPRCKKTFSRSDALKRHVDRTCGARDDE
ncbi:hypothetical protein BDV98DRAFT_412485 [Pterulicium gracile]|uniref:C2H2-type domain-containing protein n=1 Tax=Pterulicium gracile TaxID=1884261 RepID=A0A5C3QXB5_9AGAR|nr:hypothetical protein BDV98DRAFT_412485 [Pterula gracilis]